MWDFVTVRNYAETCKGIYSNNLVYNFLIYIFSLKSLVFMVCFVVLALAYRPRHSNIIIVFLDNNNLP